MDTQIRQAIIHVATERGHDNSTCPSEIARQLFPDHWRNQMQAIRDVAFDLQKAGKVRITQKGLPVDQATVKGPIRIKII